MADETWPATLPPPDWDSEEQYYKPQRKAEFEANYIQVYPRASRGRLQLTLKWKVMTETQYQALKSFFDDNQGKSFTWTHPIAETTHTCVFSGDRLVSTPYTAAKRRNVQCPIEEV
jgi:phage-related protein